MSDRSTRLQGLARVPLFAGLGRDELSELCGLLQERSLRKGELLCKEGEPGDSFFLIERGELEVRSQADAERVLRRLGPGDFVGEIALLLGGARTATVTASRPSALLALAKDDFQRLFGANPTVIEYLSRVLAQRMAASSQGTAARRSTTSVAVWGRAGARGKTLVAEALAGLLGALSGREVLRVELSTGASEPDLTSLEEAAEGSPDGLPGMRRDPAGFSRLSLRIGPDCDEARLAAAADALVWKGRERFPLVVFDLPASPLVHADSVSQLADVAVEVAARLPAGPPPEAGARHFRVLNRWHEQAEGLDVAHCEPFVLPADLALHAAEPAERVRLLLERPRSPASPPLRRLAHKILGTSLGMALGGGAAFGIAHVGVFRALERHGIHVDLVAGTSMGSIVALGYAAGMEPDTMHEIALRIGNRRTTLSALDFTVSRPGLLAGNRLVAIFAPLLGSVQGFDQLAFPCRTVAADIESGERVCISSGRLADAFRASCSVPMLWSPVRRGGRVLVDGGMVDPVPADVVKEMGADLCLAVNVVPQLKKGVETALSRWYRLGNSANPLSLLGMGHDLPSTFDTVMNTIQVLQHELGKFKAISAELRIDPDLSDFTWVEFYRPAELIERGEQAAEEAVPRLQALLRERLEAGFAG